MKAAPDESVKGAGKGSGSRLPPVHDIPKALPLLTTHEEHLLLSNGRVIYIMMDSMGSIRRYGKRREKNVFPPPNKVFPMFITEERSFAVERPGVSEIEDVEHCGGRRRSRWRRRSWSKCQYYQLIVSTSALRKEKGEGTVFWGMFSNLKQFRLKFQYNI